MIDYHSNGQVLAFRWDPKGSGSEVCRDSSEGIRQRISWRFIRRDQAADLVEVHPEGSGSGFTRRVGSTRSIRRKRETPLFSQCCALPNIVEQLSFSKLRSFVSLFRPSANKSFCLILPDSNIVTIQPYITHRNLEPGSKSLYLVLLYIYN